MREQFYLFPTPFSPVQSDRKLSAVLGTMSLKSSMTIRPRKPSPSTSTSKKTTGRETALTLSPLATTWSTIGVAILNENNVIRTLNENSINNMNDDVLTYWNVRRVQGV